MQRSTGYEPAPNSGRAQEMDISNDIRALQQAVVQYPSASGNMGPVAQGNLLHEAPGNWTQQMPHPMMAVQMQQVQATLFPVPFDMDPNMLGIAAQGNLSHETPTKPRLRNEI